MNTTNPTTHDTTSPSSKNMTSQSHQPNTPLIVDDTTLFCEEEHYWDDDAVNSPLNKEEHISSLNPKPLITEQDLTWDDEELTSLLTKEQENGILANILQENPFLAKARSEAVEWMVNVVGYYSFSPLTAILAVNYLDRFLSSFQFQREKPWMAQLTAVACLSLAAKVEETDVPLLLDFQVEESKYVFESKTIQRMEILVLSTLKWRMNPVTPLSFLDHIVRRLALKGNVCRDFLRRCEGLLLSAISDCRFMCYLPSALATATMLYVISSLEPCSGVEYQDQLVGILGINKDKVEECCRLIQEVATSVHFHSNKKRKFGYSLPGSPKGVVDVSFSCSSESDDSSNDSWAWASNPSVSSSPEPLSKKIKAHEDQDSNFLISD